ncbi:hypothetical protein JYU34_021021 [Plutella xylostella]|uniref:Nuclease HARBI1 n=1 Tax=Plutella xylostella TaxID=51655 RepID=A0ABQ7PSI6_PLUXY|nr:hypothetical protein JYU34_021021 [Plutella xylostella]
MDFQFENMVNLFEEVDNLLQEPVVDFPRFPKCYLRDVVDPFRFFSDDQFKLRYRFSKSTVVNIILPELEELNTYNQRGLPIALDQQLLIALRFYATGSFQKVCGDLHYLSQPTVCHIIERVSSVLATKLNKYIYFPRTRQDTETLKNAFEDLGATRNLPGLPDIVGAIDCTHIKITRPRGIEHSEAYRNRHGWFSINVQVGK